MSDIQLKSYSTEMIKKKFLDSPHFFGNSWAWLNYTARVGLHHQ